tara:strand:+ start:530 stop:1354 length:825 start_codon:yes stop_codon:yes gene_type:complete
MEALIDADLVAYESASAAEMTEDGIRRNFDYVVQRVEDTIEFIVEYAGCSSYSLYITGKDNFRHDIATLKPYKGNRKKEKPFYLEATRKLLEGMGAIVCDGMEADDMLAVEAKRREPESFVICSRDKDLRMIPCWQYSWEVGNQPEWGPQLVDELGELHVRRSTKILKSGEQSNAITKIWGTGLMWFYCQMITGDTTDNISGLEGKGAGLAYEILPPCKNEEELMRAVYAEYEKKYGELAEERMLEQGRLLWMHNELDDEGKVILWELPYGTVS